MKALVPNTVTLMGIAAALLALVWAPWRPYWACNALIAAALFDMIDGRVARALDAQSALGQHLDSLVDLVAFGVAPAYLAHVVALNQFDAVGGVPLGIVPMFAFVAASAIRLARFNTRSDTGSAAFEGIPTPVSALLIITSVMTWHELSLSPFGEPWFLCALMLTASVLMVAPIEFPSFKRFRTRAASLLYFGSMFCGLAMLVFGLPGGAVLFGLVAFYVVRGIVGFLWIRRR